MIYHLLATYALVFLITQTEGPFGIISFIRNILMRNSIVGVFFYKLFECPFCLGFWCSILVYFLHESVWQWNLVLFWGLTGAISSLILDSVITKLNNINQNY